jgi:hypothetical protein
MVLVEGAMELAITLDFSESEINILPIQNPTQIGFE